MQEDSTVKKSLPDIRVILAIVLAVLSAVTGGFAIYRGFSNSNLEMADEYSAHLLDTVWMVDSSLDFVMSSTRAELKHAALHCRAFEDRFLLSGDREILLQQLRSQLLIASEYVQGVLVMRDGELLLSTGSVNSGEYTFSYGQSTEAPCLFTDGDGKNYLAMIEHPAKSKLDYVVLIDLEKLYQQIVNESVLKDCWLVLYDASTGLFLQNDKSQPEVKKYTVQEAIERNDGISILARSEVEHTVATERYTFEDDLTVMAVLPTAVNRNGTFAVGIALSTRGFRSVLNASLWRAGAGGFLVLLGFGGLLLVLIQNRRSNSLMRERVQLLEVENKAMQEVAHRQRLEMLGTMTSGIAHEFNNLLTPIMSYSILTMEQLPPECEELIDNLTEIYEASEKAKTLISRMSAMSRKNTESANHRFSPDALIGNVLTTVKPNQPRTVTVETDLCCPEKCLLANETRVGQLLMNIILNALQAMEQTGGRLQILSRREGDRVVIRLQDTGPGISPEIMGKLFDPFFTTKEAGKGTGLGLAIARQIAESYNGMITVRSSLGEGTTFTVQFPYSAEEEDPSE